MRRGKEVGRQFCMEGESECCALSPGKSVSLRSAPDAPLLLNSLKPKKGWAHREIRPPGGNEIGAARLDKTISNFPVRQRLLRRGQF
jgi:hypothetical protein